MNELKKWLEKEIQAAEESMAWDLEHIGTFSESDAIRQDTLRDVLTVLGEL